MATFICHSVSEANSKKILVYSFTPSHFLLASVFISFSHIIILVLRVLFVYQGVSGIWGFGKILSLVVGNNKLVFILYKLVFLFGFFFFSVKMKEKKVVDELLFLFLVFFIFTPGFGIQWLLWPIPFLFILSPTYTVLIYSGLSIPVFIGYLSWILELSIKTKMVDTIFFCLWIFITSFLVIFNIVKRKLSFI